MRAGVLLCRVAQSTFSAGVDSRFCDAQYLFCVDAPGSVIPAGKSKAFRRTMDQASGGLSFKLMGVSRHRLGGE
jgi:hypothetical protein